MSTTKVYSDNEKLELVFLKLGLAETDDELQKIINNFLVPVLLILSNNDESVRTKVLELLTHINKRIKARQSIKLPLQRLVQQLNDSSVSPFVKNFTITYIKTGFPRQSVGDRVKILPTLFTSVEGKPKLQQDMILRFVVESLPLVKAGSLSFEYNKLLDFNAYKDGTALLLEFFLDVLLIPYSISIQASSSEASSRSPSAAPGLSLEAVKKISGDAAGDHWSAEQIESIKLAILDLFKADLLDPNDIVCHLIVASSDTKHTVASVADLELRRRLSDISWDDKALNVKLYKLYLGDAAVLSKKNRDPREKREPASIRLKLKIVSNLNRSSTAGQCFPQSIQLLFDGLFGKTNAKLQLLTLQLLHSIISKSNDNTVLLKQAPLLLDALTKVSSNQEMSTIQRGLAYTGLALLSKKLPQLFHHKLNLLQSLFEALEKEESGDLKSAIQDALTVLAHAYKEFPDGLLLIQSFIEKSIASKDLHMQLVGIHYAAILFPSNHIPSRYQLLLALGHQHETVVANAHKVLFPSIHDDNKTGQDQCLPEFSAMLKYIHENAELRLKTGKQFIVGNKAIPFPPQAYQAIIIYMRRCLVGDATKEYSKDLSKVDSTDVVKQIHSLMNMDKVANVKWLAMYTQLCLQYLNAITDEFVMSLMLEAVASCDEDITVENLMCTASHTESRMGWLRNQVANIKENIRIFAAEIYAIAIRRGSQSSTKYPQLITELLPKSSNQSLEVQHGNILLLGHLLGDWLCNSRRDQDETMEVDTEENVACNAVKYLVRILKTDREPLLACAACSAIGEIARKTTLPLQDGDVASQSDEGKDEDMPVTKLSVVQALLSHLDKKRSHKLREAVVLALGRLPVGDSKFPHTEKVLLSLLEASEVKDVELHFGVGNALCSASLAENSPEKLNRWCVNEALEYNYTGDEKVKWVLEKILDEYVMHRLPAVRQASGIWLIVMLKTASFSQHPYIRERLVDLQNAFQCLLSEADDFTQDIASKGFGMVYEMADPALKKHLVDQLVGSLTGSSRPPSSKVRIIGQEGRSLFQGSSVQLGKAPDGSSLSTYKELCSLASDLNQPDLVYKFLQLANHHSLWNTKKGAAFGFRNIALAAKEELEPYLPQIVPRLYRYTFDPNPSVRSAMTSIWNVIAPESKKMTDTFYGLILDDLLSNLTSNVWRTREASCLALTNLLYGGVVPVAGASPASDGNMTSNADLLIARLPELWRVVFRVRDDIKETVRDAAQKTSQKLKSVTLRFCEDSSSNISKNGSLSEILNVLLSDGLNSNVDGIKELSLSTLVEISKVSGTAIKPCLVQMIMKLLESLSAMEAPLLNYLHTRSSGTTQSALDIVRAQSVKSHPLMETTTRCLEQCDSSHLKELVSALSDLTKRGVGLSTKAGCSYAIRTIISVYGAELQPFCGKLINALTTGLQGRSVGIRKLHSQTIGQLSSAASDETIEKMVNKMKTWYLEKEDDNLKQASVSVIKALAQSSPDVFSRHSSVLLPLAFYGMCTNVTKKQSTSTETLSDNGDGLSSADMWKSIWDEFTPGIESALRLYMAEIIDLCSACLKSNQWPVKAQSATALSFMIKKQHSKDVVEPHTTTILQVLLEGLRGRWWDGKEKLIEALRDVSVHCVDLISNEQLAKILEAFLNESKRGKKSTRIKAISSLADVLEAHKHDIFIDFSKVVLPYLEPKEKNGSSSSEEESDSRAEQRKSSWDFKEKALKSLSKAFIASSTQTQVQHFEEIFTLVSGYSSLSTHAMQLTSLSCVGDMLASLGKVKVENSVADMTVLCDIHQKICSIVTSPLCSNLGNVKFSSLREEALKVTRSFLDLIICEHCRPPSEKLQLLLDALRTSPVNTSLFKDYDLVANIMNQLSQQLNAENSSTT